MINFSISARNNQAKNKIVCLAPKEFYNTIDQIAVYSQTAISIFNYLIKLYNCYGPNTHPSQSHIAVQFGISREWVNKIIKLLCQSGLLIKQRVIKDGKNTACLYSLPSVLFDLNVRWNLSSLLPALKWSYMPTYISNLVAKAKEKVSQFTSNKYIYLKKFLKITSKENNAIKSCNSMQLSKKGESMATTYNPTNNVLYNPELSKQIHDREIAKTNQELKVIKDKTKQAQSKPNKQLAHEYVELYKKANMPPLADAFARIIYGNFISDNG